MIKFMISKCLIMLHLFLENFVSPVESKYISGLTWNAVELKAMEKECAQVFIHFYRRYSNTHCTSLAFFS